MVLQLLLKYKVAQAFEMVSLPPQKKTKPLAKLLAKSWKLQSLHVWQTNLVCHYSFKPQLKDIFVFWGSSSIIIQLLND